MNYINVNVFSGNVGGDDPNDGGAVLHRKLPDPVFRVTQIFSIITDSSKFSDQVKGFIMFSRKKNFVIFSSTKFNNYYWIKPKFTNCLFLVSQIN